MRRTLITIIILGVPSLLADPAAENLRRELNTARLRKAFTEHPLNWESARQNIREIIEEGVSTVDIEEEFDDACVVPLLFRPIENNDIPLCELILKKGANPNASWRCSPYKAPLIFSVESVEMVRLLRSYGAKLDVVDSNERTLLHYSISFLKDDKLFDYFLEHGADPKKLDIRGRNLWHALIGNPKYLVVCPEKDFLLRAKKLQALGISPWKKNYDGMSAVDILVTQIGLMLEETKGRSNAFLSKEACSGFEAQRIKDMEKLERFRQIIENLCPQD